MSVRKLLDGGDSGTACRYSVTARQFFRYSGTACRYSVTARQFFRYSGTACR
ncbi:hypothetical protein [Cohnella cholangitidis]|uniref:hypothetical protein n=1 Tax=Cohnella cholangitidis TaxID=2598458 RepID=UPI0015F7C67B|nr:hypothetical protein [Cohnella cholangitidis]